MKLVMTLILRDEADVLEDNLRYHFAHGVDFVIATDNASGDGSREILERYAQAGLVHVIDEPSDEYRREQAGWYTRMARLAAAEFGADWVFNNDADEFWWPVAGGTLKDVFASIPDRYGALAAPRPEFVPRPDGDGPFHERLVVRQARSQTGPKVAHRGVDDVVVFYGSHRIGREGEDGVAGARHAGRPLLRSASQPQDDGDGLVPAPRWPIRILHFPLRSYAQFERRLKRLVLQEGMALEGRRKELHDQYAAGRLPEVYAEMVEDEAAIEAGLREGRLVRDTGLRDHLPRCPDPLAGGPVVVEVGVEDAEREAGLAEVEEDMMRALARTEHTLLSQRARARGRFRECQEELEAARRRQRELEQRLAGLRGSRWGRLRAATARLAARLRPSGSS